MFAARVNIDLADLVVFDKTYNLSKDEYILVKAGCLYNQIKANDITIVKDNITGLDDKISAEQYLIKIDIEDKATFIAVYGADAYIKKLEEAEGPALMSLDDTDGENNNNKKSKNNGNSRKH